MPKPNRLLTLSVFMACFSSMTQADEPILFSVQASAGLDNRSSSTLPIPISINSDIAQLTVGDSIQFPALDSKTSYRVNIEKVIRHSITDVTLIGSVENQGDSNRAIITVGQAGSYANIATPNGDYRIELDHGQNLLWTPSTQANFDTPSYIDDMLIPDRVESLRKPDGVISEQQGLVIKDASNNNTTIDLMILYTHALETRLGGAAALQTRLNHLVSVSNQAYEDSQVKINLRLVHTEPTNYSNNASANNSLLALQQHSGEFSQVPSLRTQYGADLVMLVQDYVPEHFSCGLAYRLGDTNTGHMMGGTFGDQAYAFSIIHDGRYDLSGGSYSFCPEHTLAHEVGHSLGAAHDQDHLG
ncbi:MAG: hypothetical protein KAG66_11125, partial [Methylococcales bacterium]|nr:hypothetical protein [Methylococcales bacterium]